MIRITDTPKPRDRFGSIPIRANRPLPDSASRPPRRPKRSFPGVWLKRIVTLFLCLPLLLGLGGFLLVPYLATAILPKHLAGALNRPVTIARAEFNPLTCTLALHQLIVGPQLSQPDDPVDPLLSAGRISLACEAKRLLDGELACSLDAERFFLHLLRQKEDGYNLGPVLADLLPTIPALPLRFSWKAIAVRNSRLVFDDGQTGKTHLAEALTLTLSPGALHLQATINGTPIILPDGSIPSRPSNPLPAGPDPAEAGGNDKDPAGDASSATEAEELALARELTQVAGKYLQPLLAP